MTIGQRIKLKREERGLSQLELAKKVGYETKGAVSMVEAGKREIPLEKLSEIAKVLNVSPNWLLGWAEDPILIRTDLSITIDELEDLNSDQLQKVRDYIQYLKFEGGKK